MDGVEWVRWCSGYGSLHRHSPLAYVHFLNVGTVGHPPRVVFKPSAADQVAFHSGNAMNCGLTPAPHTDTPAHVD